MSKWDVDEYGFRSWESPDPEPRIIAWLDNEDFLNKVFSGGIKLYSHVDLDMRRDEYLKYWEKITPKQIQNLLNTGVYINMENRTGNTALHMAAWFNETPEVFTMLLDAGADVHAKDKHDETPLHGAAGYNKNPKVISILLDAGADVNALDRDETAPIHYAAWLNKNPEVIATLLDAGANVNLLVQQAEAEYLTEAGDYGPGTPPYLHTDYIDGTPLHMLAGGNFKTIALLLDAGADVNAPDYIYKNTPLHTAAWFNENPEVIMALLKAGADGKVKNNRGKTPFDYAKENKFINGTEAYWALHDAQY